MQTQTFVPSQPLSLAAYRELQSHLQQLPGIRVKLLAAQHQQFNYADSQVVGLEICYSDSEIIRQLQSILQHYEIAS